jgi:hypothetical protein
MNNDPEMERWQSLWQAEAPISPDLRERAIRQVRRARVMLLGDIAVTVIIGGGVILWALSSHLTAVRLLTAWVWFTIFAAWIFRYFNHRGNWTGLAPSTDAFFEAWVKRCRNTRRNLIFGIALGCVQFSVCSVWVNAQLHRMHGMKTPQFVTMTPMVIAYLCAAGLLIWALWLFRKVNAELRYIERLSDEWADGQAVSDALPISPSLTRRPRALEAIALISKRFESLGWPHRWRRNRIKFPAR